MPKVIAAPEKFQLPTKKGDPEKFMNNPWTGSVTISDRLYLPQVELIEAGLEPVLDDAHKSIWLTSLDKPKIPAILACVEKWELKDFPESPTVDNFPMSPRNASHNLIAWLFTEIRNVYIGELDIPNE